MFISDTEICLNTKRKQIQAMFKCDNCYNEFSVKYEYTHAYKNYTRYKNKEYHFCSVKCANVSQSNNKLLAQVKIKTYKEHFGNDIINPGQVIDVRKKVEQTCLIRLGTTSSLANKACRLKGEQTSLQRYGKRYYTQTQEYKDNVDYTEMTKKRHVTMKRNGSFYKESSIEEDKFYILLCELFNIDDIIRHALINNWKIDFYIISTETYIQFDGIYWHGLDRHIDEIRQFKTKHDEIIYKTYLRDIKQVEWFEENNIKLIRIISSEYKKHKNDINFYKTKFTNKIKTNI